ncbi:MAG: outer membrane beta-barrel protein [Bacteroidota bacterium]
MIFKKLLIAVLFVCAFTSAKAQLSVGGGVSFPIDLGELGLLARGTYDFDETWRGAATFTYYLDGLEGITIWSLDFDANYSFTTSGSIKPYVLAGLSLLNAGISLDLGPFGTVSESDTEFGVSLGGGAIFPAGNVNFFGEGRLRTAAATDFAITGGVLFPLGN